MNIINEENLEEFKAYILEGKTIPQLQEIYKCSRTTITSAKKHFGLVGLTPNSKKINRELGIKKCKECGIEKNLSEFYSNGKSPSGKQKYKSKCKKCTSKEYNYTKNKVIEEYLFSVSRQYICEVCGYRKNTAALEFHHTNPDEKEYTISNISKTISKEKLYSILETELPKCVILCANCHREWHNPYCNTGAE